MVSKEINYVDYIALKKCVEKYKDFNLVSSETINKRNKKNLTNIIGVGQLGKYFIDYCKSNNRWNEDNIRFAKSSNKTKIYSEKIEYLNNFSIVDLEDYMNTEHENGELNIFLYNLSELGEFDKLINKVSKLEHSFNVILGVKTKHSKLQFDIIVNRLSIDAKVPVIVVDEDRLLKETNNYIIYELYNLARSCVEF